VRRAVGDVMLFSAFALHHSLFARDIFRKRITRIVGALERSMYVWVASAIVHRLVRMVAADSGRGVAN
jgi:hypothetical protein